MEPNKIEKQFREKLNQREIKPSAAAWDRLDAMLTVAEKPKRSISRWYIAASVVGLLLVGTAFFNQNKKIITLQKQVVVQEKDTATSTLKNNEPANLTPVLTSKSAVVVVRDKNTPKQIQKDNNLKPQKSLANAENILVNTTPKTEQELNINPMQTVQPRALLASVPVTSFKDKTTSSTQIKVNAVNLLSQVDGELDLSFREKMIAKVNKNYQTVKVALVNRNQE
ncbi:hypothetical protein [Flavobacterium restrictum]|uniref:Anti-sigma factor n=1 Tax=Flavobacterium restrictum TaxID=2594428 RepID=A0A553E9G0_9FLAO|nr:hypothetical protein [Flavobacterium restrictum]TRX41531.1 hypothetical protein FNW21_05405 [Flavobacterium restrictum]